MTKINFYTLNEILKINDKNSEYKLKSEFNPIEYKNLIFHWGKYWNKEFVKKFELCISSNLNNIVKLEDINLIKKILELKTDENNKIIVKNKKMIINLIKSILFKVNKIKIYKKYKKKDTSMFNIILIVLLIMIKRRIDTNQLILDDIEKQKRISVMINKYLNENYKY